MNILVGYKTYIAVALAFVVMGLAGLNVIPLGTATTFVTGLLGLGVAGARAAAAATSKSQS